MEDINNCREFRKRIYFGRGNTRRSGSDALETRRICPRGNTLDEPRSGSFLFSNSANRLYSEWFSNENENWGRNLQLLRK